MFKNVVFDVRAQLKSREGCGGSSGGKIAYHQARRPEFDPRNHMVAGGGGHILFDLVHIRTQVKRTNKCEKEEKQQKGVGGGTVVEDTLNAGWSVNSSYGLVMCTPTMGRQQRAVSE